MSEQNSTESRRLRQEQFERAVERHHGHNFRMMVAEGSLFIAAMVLYSGVTVLSAFLTRLGASAQLIGITMGAFAFTWTSVQLYAAYREGHLPEKRRTIMLRRFLGGLVWMAMAAALFFLYQDTPGRRRLATVALLVAVVCFAMLCGYSVPLWVDFVGKIFREDSRGRYYGWRNGLGAAMGLGVSVLVLSPLLKYVDFPYGYAWSFLIAGLCVSAGALFLGRSREAAPPEPRGPASPGEFVRDLAATWRGSRGFKVFCLSAVLYAVGGAGMGGCMIVPFFMRKAIQQLGADDFYVGVATSVLVAGQIVGAMLGGRLVDRTSAKLLYFLNLVTSALTSLLAIYIMDRGLWLFLAVFLLAGASRGMLSTCYHNCVLELVPVSQRPQAIGMVNFLRSPFMLLGPFLGGVLLAGMGFEVLFLVAYCVAGLLLPMSLFWVGLQRAPAPGG